MRKKELIKLNEELFSRAESYKAQIADIKGQLEALNQKIDELTLENTRLKTPIAASTEPLKTLEEKVLTKVSLPDDTNYGAEIIGKIVVNATIACNKLTSSGEGGQVKELVNLILGRTEIAKGEILKVVSSNMTLNDKKVAIDTELSSCDDYFQSVMAQKD